MQFTWAFVTVFISQITVIVLEHFSPSPSQPQLPGCLILFFCRSAKWPMTQWQSWTGIWPWKPKSFLDENPPWAAVLQSPVPRGPRGWQVGTCLFHHTGSCHRAAVSASDRRPSRGTLSTLFLLSPDHRICSGPSGMGGPQRRSCWQKACTWPFVLTMTSPSCQDHWQACAVCSSSREPSFQTVSQALSPLLNSA